MSIALPQGVQTPRIMLVPDYGSSAGAEAIELAALAGLELDPWEALVLEHSLGEGTDGRWAAADVGLCVPRQNGKNAVLEARELAGLFLLNEPLIIHSAQHFKTAKEHFLRLYGLIESTPDLSRRVRKVTRTHGEEGIELKGGQRILFFARTKSSGRGFTAPVVVFDEAMFLAESSMGALVPTQSALPNRQRWYAGSAVDQLIHPDGVVFARVRERALSGTDPRLAYFEWSVDAEQPEHLDDERTRDPEEWALANPGFGIRIMPEAIEDELRALDTRTFAVERLGVGDWPDTSGLADFVIPPEKWKACEQENSTLINPVCLAFDISPERRTSIAAAGQNEEGLWHVEVVEHAPGTNWVVAKLIDLETKHSPMQIVCDAVGPAASLIIALDQAGVPVERIDAPSHAEACGRLVDVVNEENLRHRGSMDLWNAVRGAKTRPLGDRWAWSRKNSSVDISPLVAATLALYAAMGGDYDDEGPVIY